MPPILQSALLLRALPALRGMGMAASLRAGIGLIAIAGRGLALTEAERRAILARVERALLGREAAEGETRLET
jgi:hypothetical protein